MLFEMQLTYCFETDAMAMLCDHAGKILLLARCMSGDASQVLAQTLNTAARETTQARRISV